MTLRNQNKKANEKRNAAKQKLFDRLIELSFIFLFNFSISSDCVNLIREKSEKI